MKAYCLLKPEPSYRREAFVSGFQAIGYEVSCQYPSSLNDGDILCLWNRYFDEDILATKFEAAGGVVIVAENGYTGKDANGIQTYAISVHGHNGSGWYPVGAVDRFAPLNIRLEPWKTAGDYVLVCGQRGIGTSEMRSPDNWHEGAERKLKELWKPVKVRLHPGTRDLRIEQPPLDQDLGGSSACAIWSSSSGVQALIKGIPVVYDAPHWICEGAASKGMAGINNLVRDDAIRIEALKKMAWGQWFVDEIQQGLPFDLIREHIAEAAW